MTKGLLIILSGLPGSGKSTTLYAALTLLNDQSRNILTVEDPIEYGLDGVGQTQVNTKVGMTFATGLRAILRQDPDIVMVGEIRDGETADIAVRASLTGHLVLSTLHTNDAPSAVTRLVDMGIEPYLVSSCLEGVIAQRLVRRVCPHCAKAATIDANLLPELEKLYNGLPDLSGVKVGAGCAECNFTGHYGRTALHEIMMMDDGIRQSIVHNEPANKIREIASANGLKTLRQKGWDMLLRGTTTVEEVLRVTQKESYHS